MPRRALALSATATVVLCLLVGGALLPVPYVALLPGPTKNVLAKAQGEPLIGIDGHEVYPASGHLNLVTVAYRGGPGRRLNLFTALRWWADPDVAVVPQSALFPQGKTTKEVRRAASRRMVQSQQNATVAALRELGIPVDATVTVARVIEKYPANGRLRKGDVLLAVNGQEINGPLEVSRLVASRQPGEAVRFTLRRGGERMLVRVPTVADPRHPGQAIVGVYMRTEYDYPLRVDIRIDEIGGPSAGTVFALGVVDKLTKGDLTGGRFVAGTGTITPTGQVGPVGGIAQKLAGAEQDGASVFLTPARNCAEAKESKPPGLRLVKIETLHGALRALRALGTGRSVPSC